MAINIQLATQEWVNNLGLGGGGSTINEVTYQDLTILINTNVLTIGQKYLITDYQTVHIIPSTINSDINTGNIEPLLVTASGTNTLSPLAYSSLYPKDIIYYDFNNDFNMIFGSTKGYIYRRIDTLQNNDIPFDFRNVKFRRWQLYVSNVWNTDITYNKNDVMLDGYNIYICLKNNIIGINPSSDYTHTYKLLEFQNLSYASPTSDNWIISNLIIPCSTEFMDYYVFNYSSSIFNNTLEQTTNNIINNNNSVFLGSNIYNNKIGSYFDHNTIADNFQNNTIRGIFYNNLIESSFKNNVIGINSYDNVVGSGFSYNNIESEFFVNIIGNDFSYNTIGTGFQINTIGNAFIKNILGNNCNYNILGSSFIYNVIGNDFNNNICENMSKNNIGSTVEYNTIGTGFMNNNIGTGFMHNTVGNDFMYNNIGNDFMYISIGSSFQMNTVCENFNSFDFTYSTYVYNTYTKEIFINSLNEKKLIYNKMTIEDAIA